MHGWTSKHDALLQELVHHTMPGGSNEKNPPLTWEEIGERWHWLAPQRGLGNKAFPWKKIAARYYEHIKPLHEKIDQDLAMNTARNAGKSSLGKGKGKGRKLGFGGDGHEFFETMEGWEQALEGNKKAAEEGVGKEGFFDTMEQMNEEKKTTEST